MPIIEGLDGAGESMNKIYRQLCGKLDCTGIMRSNDIWLGTPYIVSTTTSSWR